MIWKRCLESLSSLLNNWLCIYPLVLRLFFSTVSPIPQHVCDTAVSILYYTFDPSSLQCCLSNKKLAVKVNKVKLECFIANTIIFCHTIHIKIQWNTRLATFQPPQKKSSHILATNGTGFSHGPFLRVGITASYRDARMHLKSRCVLNSSLN